MARTIKVESLTELQRQMLRLETAIEPQDVKPILAKALEPIYTRAISNLKSLVRTGGPLGLPDQMHIEDALKISEGKSAKRAAAWLRVWRQKAPQGVWIEFGHVLWRGGKRRQGKGKQIGEVKARPFFRPAISSERKNTEKLIETGVKKLIERFTARY